jgi:hypothetical protein
MSEGICACVKTSFSNLSIRISRAFEALQKESSEEVDTSCVDI